VGETIFSGFMFEEKVNAELLLRRWKKGVPSYRTVFITRKDSSVRKLSDLMGKTIAFEDPGSTSSYFIPVAELLSAGLPLVELKSPGQAVPVGKVGYVFSRNELNLSTWVYKGLVDAGAYSNLNWKNDKDTPKKSRQSMRIFHKTVEVPRAVEIVRNGLSPLIKARLKKILLQANKDSAAKAVLKSYGKTSKFDSIKRVPAESMKQARRMFKTMHKARLQ
ncbi:MAG: phosphate/phosphite/phosphonate ABC transporter substrate-binding protein, partial [Gammaproteobacteria bacterium]|nr:phosphate/phosphite/phosphonate ABC transporter substrate-binding protein [Gammaproteobacteria bacterium]